MGKALLGELSCPCHRSCYVMGKALLGQLSCPCDRSCYVMGKELTGKLSCLCDRSCLNSSSLDELDLYMQVDKSIYRFFHNIWAVVYQVLVKAKFVLKQFKNMKIVCIFSNMLLYLFGYKAGFSLF